MKKNQWEINYDATECKVICIQSKDFKMDDERPIKFRLKDDDGEVNFYGKMQQLEFDPLDDFGAPAYGCTELEYLKDGEWVAL